MRSTMLELGAVGHATRQARSALRREIGDGPLIAGLGQLATVIEDRPACLQRLLLFDVMLWPRSMQSRIARRYLRLAGISEFAVIERLTERQRDVLVETLRSHRTGVPR